MSSYRPKGTIIHPELTEFIIKTWNDGDNTSLGKIAKAVLEKFQVSMTPSAVAGRLTRAEQRGMKIRRTGGLAGRNARCKAAREAPAAPKPPKVHRDRSLLGSLPPLPPAPPDLSCRLTLEEVQAKNGCRFPAGHTPNMRFCGERKDPRHESYCPAHYALSIAEFQPVWEIRP